MLVLAPALLLFATMLVALVVYGALHVTGRAPQLAGVKHNQLLGPFMGGYIVWLIAPIERALIGRVTPNTITLSSLAFCIATGFAAAYGFLGAAVWLYAVGGILDILDGRLARLGHQQTKSGALVDSVSDRWAEIAVFAGYAWYLRDSAWLFAVIAATGSSLMVSYTRARAESLGVALAGGAMQRAERILLIALGTLVAALFSAHAIAILGVVMTICATSCTATAIGRWVTAYRALARLDGIRAKPRTEIVVVPAKLRESAELAIR
jgi:CDP-diacylglycerol--glycerol-3-phosphate 3-phosphatidyltransferase